MQNFFPNKYKSKSFLDVNINSFDHTSLLAKGFWSAPVFLRSGVDQKPLASEDVDHKQIIGFIPVYVLHVS